MTTKTFISLDVGEKRIGVAVADSLVRIAVPLETVHVDGAELEQLKKIIAYQEPDVLVVGYPRNQSGEATQQTRFVEDFCKKIASFAPPIEYQDESLTSVLAEERLKSHKKPYAKEDVDAQAAAIILQDYLEARL